MYTKPPQESERLDALATYEILDTPREPEYDAIVDLIATACDAPVVLVNFLDRDRQWFKAAHGFDSREYTIEEAICLDAIVQDDVVVIPDISRDPHYAHFQVVTDLGMRAYAAMPLRTPDGIGIGTLCILRRQPGGLSELQRAVLRALGEKVMLLLEQRRLNRERVRLNAELSRLDLYLTHDSDVLENRAFAALFALYAQAANAEHDALMDVLQPALDGILDTLTIRLAMSAEYDDAIDQFEFLREFRALSQEEKDRLIALLAEEGGKPGLNS